MHRSALVAPQKQKTSAKKTPPPQGVKDGPASKAEFWLQTFLDALAVERGASPSTRVSYQSDLRHFSGFLSSKKSVFEASQEDVREYAFWLQSQGLASTTQARRFSALKQFFNFLYEEGVRSDIPTLQLKAPRGSLRKRKRVPTCDDIDKLIETLKVQLDDERAQGDKAFKLHRLIVLLELSYGSGLRVSELLGVRLEDIHQYEEQAYLFVRGKGGKERYVPLSSLCLEAIAIYLPLRAQTLKKRNLQTPFLYPSLTNGHARPLTRQRFYQLIKNVAVRARLDPDLFSPHALRHAFGTHLLVRGANILEVQSMLGHSSVSTTRFYTHMTHDHLKETLVNMHPLATPRPLKNKTKDPFISSQTKSKASGSFLGR